jgi:hypothetical protein
VVAAARLRRTPRIDGPGIDRPGIDGSGIDGPGIDGSGIDGPGIDGPGIDLYTAQDDTPPNPLYTAQRNTPHNPLHTAQDHENGSELPTLRANNQTTLGTNLDNLTLPVRQNFLGQVLIQLYCNKTLQWLRDSQSGIDDSNMSNVYSLNFAVSYSKS